MKPFWPTFLGLFTQVWWLVFGPAAFAASPPVELRAQVDRAVIPVDGEVMFKIELEQAPGMKLDIPDVGPQIRALRIVDFGTDPVSRVDGRILKRRWYKLHADVAGSYVLPALSLEYESASGEKKTAQTSEIFVEAKADDTQNANTPELGGDIRDIKPLIPMGLYLPTWAWMTIGVLALITLVFAIRAWRKRRKRPEAKKEVPPHVEALCRLEDLRRDKYHHNGEVKKFAFTLSEIARSYVERKYHFTATDMTLEEIRRRIDRLSDFDENLREKYLKVLSETDLVKFTDFGLVPDRGDELLALTEQIVELTSPPPTEGSQAGTGTDQNREDAVI